MKISQIYNLSIFKWTSLLEPFKVITKSSSLKDRSQALKTLIHNMKAKSISLLLLDVLICLKIESWKLIMILIYLKTVGAPLIILLNYQNDQLSIVKRRKIFNMSHFLVGETWKGWQILATSTKKLKDHKKIIRQLKI